MNTEVVCALIAGAATVLAALAECRVRISTKRTEVRAQRREKESRLAMDLMYATTSVSGIYFKALETYCIAAVFYLVMTYLSSLLMKAISRKLDTNVKELPSSN